MKKLLLFMAFVLGVACVQAQDYPGNFALRTNLLYDALLTPTLGMEWRMSDSWGVKLDGSYGYFTGSVGKKHNVWLVSPEVRHYLGKAKRFYLGLGANAGGYDIYRLGPVAAQFRKGTGYKGELYNGGLVAGYQLKLSNVFSLDFNIGLGYTHLKYDAFTMERCESCNYRKSKKTNTHKNFLGPTQAGISLVWHIGKSKDKTAAACADATAAVNAATQAAAQAAADAAAAVIAATAAQDAAQTAANAVAVSAQDVAAAPANATLHVSDILFAFNSFELDEDAIAELKQITRWMKEHPSVHAAVRGYTDNIGRETYNQRLSEQRAQVVYDYLVSGGITAERLSVHGYGLARPVDTNTTVEGRHHNRRVELRFTKEGKSEGI